MEILKWHEYWTQICSCTWVREIRGKGCVIVVEDEGTQAMQWLPGVMLDDLIEPESEEA
jgi:hypothetical protein